MRKTFRAAATEVSKTKQSPIDFSCYSKKAVENHATLVSSTLKAYMGANGHKALECLAAAVRTADTWISENGKRPEWCDEQANEKAKQCPEGGKKDKNSTKE